jgi:hypothetical protein
MGFRAFSLGFRDRISRRLRGEQRQTVGLQGLGFEFCFDDILELWEIPSHLFILLLILLLPSSSSSSSSF